MWELEVYNNPPYFNGGLKPSDQMIRFNSTVDYPLPKFSDSEFNSIEVINKLPNFISYDPIELKYVIAPNRPSTDIGIFNINGLLTDSKKETSFKFTVTIFNDPPYFMQPLVGKVTVIVG